MEHKKQKTRPVAVMTDKGGWIFEDEDILKIKAFDIDALSKFYFANYERLKRMAYGFARRRYWDSRVDCEDMLQQVFVDLPYYNYSSRSAIYRSVIYGTFLRFSYGGITAPYNPVYSLQHLSLDKTFEDGGEDYYLLDKLVQSLPAEEILYECKKHMSDSTIFKILWETYENESELNRMYCHIFTDLKPKDIEGDEYVDFIRFEN